MFVIAQNLSDMQVDASIDEADVGRIRSGQKASFTVDAFPGQTFEGEVRQVRKAAQNVANVVTYIAVVGFQNNSGRLLPGMTANVRVVTDQRDNVLKVPNAALRVRVPGVEPEKRAEKQDQSSAGGQKDAKNDAPAAAPPVAAPGPGGNTPATEFRNKLVAELKLDAAQVEKVDAIYTEARPRFMALRDLSADERPKARERITADIRARIGDLLTPEQKAKYAALVAENAGRQSTRGRIHLLGADNKPMAFDVRLGISDGSATELLVRPGSPEADALSEGATVIIGLPTTASATPKPAAGGPRPPF
jgi:HlyD family secretion protein